MIIHVHTGYYDKSVRQYSIDLEAFCLMYGRKTPDKTAEYSKTRAKRLLKLIFDDIDDSDQTKESVQTFLDEHCKYYADHWRGLVEKHG